MLSVDREIRQRGDHGASFLIGLPHVFDLSIVFNFHVFVYTHEEVTNNIVRVRELLESQEAFRLR